MTMKKKRRKKKRRRKRRRKKVEEKEEENEGEGKGIKRELKGVQKGGRVRVGQKREQVRSKFSRARNGISHQPSSLLIN